jgi:hypothetical protein
VDLELLVGQRRRCETVLETELVAVVPENERVGSHQRTKSFLFFRPSHVDDELSPEDLVSRLDRLSNEGLENTYISNSAFAVVERDLVAELIQNKQFLEIWRVDSEFDHVVVVPE